MVGGVRILTRQTFKDIFEKRDCKPVEGLDIFEKLSHIYIYPKVIF